MNDLIDKGRACAQRVRDSKFPDYHAAKWLDRLADALESQSAENKDLKHREWHWMQAFEDEGYDSHSMRDSECMDGDECPGLGHD